MIAIADIHTISSAELIQLKDSINQHNFALYDIGSGHSAKASSAFIHKLAGAFKLVRKDKNLYMNTDSISQICTKSNDDDDEVQARTNYIPYTSKPINWHTDGYYNQPSQAIRSFILHCVSPAKSGGVNKIINPEDLYQLIKAHNPKLIDDLSRPDAFCIPANYLDGALVRDKVCAPVFEKNKKGFLMRYTARKRHIVWSEWVLDAKDYLEDMLEYSNLKTSVRLRSGQGIVCNNVLHARTGFTEDEVSQRLMLRARYFERINVS